MVVSRRLLCRDGLRLRVLCLEGRHDLRNLGIALHPLEPALAVEQRRPQPPVEPRAPAGVCEVALVNDHLKFSPVRSREIPPSW